MISPFLYVVPSKPYYSFLTPCFSAKFPTVAIFAINELSGISG